MSVPDSGIFSLITKFSKHHRHLNEYVEMMQNSPNECKIPKFHREKWRKQSTKVRNRKQLSEKQITVSFRALEVVFNLTMTSAYLNANVIDGFDTKPLKISHV